MPNISDELDKKSQVFLGFISHANKVMLKILQARLQQYVNRELPDVQAGFRKGRGTRDQIAFSKTSLNIWKFTVHVLLKPGLENFEHYFISMWDKP